MTDTAHYSASRTISALPPTHNALRNKSHNQPVSQDTFLTCCWAGLEPGLSVVSANERFLQQFDRPATTVYGRSLFDLFDPGAEVLLSRHFARLANGRHTPFVEQVIGTRASGGTFPADLIGMAMRDRAGYTSEFVVVIRPHKTPPAHAESESTSNGQIGSSRRRRSLISQLDARILEGVAGGASTIQLATRLYLSRQGVEYHVGRMMRKFRVSNRAALVSKAYSTGLLVAGTWPPKTPPDAVG